MATIFEVSGRELSAKSQKRKYKILDCADQATAYALLWAYAPTTADNMVKQDAQVRGRGANIWNGTVTYGPTNRSSGKRGDADWSFDIGTETVRIYAAKEHIADYAATGYSSKTYPGAPINVRTTNGRQTVDGSDIYYPLLTWEEKHWMAYETFGPTYLATLKNTVAHTNDDAWRDWAKGELLLLGVRGQAETRDDDGLVVGLTFRFAQSNALVNASLPEDDPQLTGISKEGWQLIWFEFAPNDDGSGNLISEVVGAHVERVYDEADYGNLGISTPFPT